MPLTELSIRSRIRSVWPVAAALAFASLLPAVNVHAQAVSTASRSAAIFVWGGVAYTQPDFGPGQDKNWGYNFGADYDRYFRFHNYPVGVGLDFRYGKTTGTIVNETTLAGGLRLSSTFRDRFHPYADFLIGRGTIDFNLVVDPNDPNYRSDSGRMFVYGGGVDIDVYKNWSIKLEGQQQSWNMGFNEHFPDRGSNTTFTLGPLTATAGIVYRIPFRSYVGAGPRRREKYVEPPPLPPTAAPSTTTTTTTDSTTTTITTAAPPADNTAPANTTPPATQPSSNTTTPPATTPQPADTTTPATTTPQPANTTPQTTGTSTPPQL